MTNFNFQKINIDKALKLRGINPDTVDTFALIDRNLTLSENFTNIVGKRKQNPITQSENKINNYLEAQDKFNNFSNKRQFYDSKVNARKTFFQDDLTNKNYSKWKKNPNRFDIEGIDTRY